MERIAKEFGNSYWKIAEPMRVFWQYGISASNTYVGSSRAVNSN